MQTGVFTEEWKQTVDTHIGRTNAILHGEMVAGERRHGLLEWREDVDQRHEREDKDRAERKRVAARIVMAIWGVVAAIIASIAADVWVAHYINVTVPK